MRTRLLSITLELAMTAACTRQLTPVAFLDVWWLWRMWGFVFIMRWEINRFHSESCCMPRLMLLIEARDGKVWSEVKWSKCVLIQSGAEKVLLRVASCASSVFVLNEKNHTEIKYLCTPVFLARGLKAASRRQFLNLVDFQNFPKAR